MNHFEAPAADLRRRRRNAWVFLCLAIFLTMNACVLLWGAHGIG